MPVDAPLELVEVHPGVGPARDLERAQALAQALGGRAIPFEAWGDEFSAIDIVISSTAAPHYVLDRAKLEPLMKLRRNRPLRETMVRELPENLTDLYLLFHGGREDSEDAAVEA